MEALSRLQECRIILNAIKRRKRYIFEVKKGTNFENLRELNSQIAHYENEIKQLLKQ